jgi:hypothetical protein
MVVQPRGEVSRYQRIFAEHAFGAADHPDQLIAWMGQHGVLDAERHTTASSLRVDTNLAFVACGTVVPASK